MTRTKDRGKTSSLALCITSLLLFSTFIFQQSKRIECPTTKRLDQTVGNTSQTTSKSREENTFGTTNE